jgi:PEP-CTERM motif
MHGWIKGSAKVIAIIVALFGFGVESEAVVVFSENFETVTPGKYVGPGLTVGQFELVSGSVDVFPASSAPCSTALDTTKCVNLDGGQPIATSGATLRASLSPGTYDLSFDLAGSQSNDTNTTRLFFGEISNFPITRAPNAPFTTLQFTATVTAANPFLVFFQEGSDGAGNLLDNVVVSTHIPEPATILLMFAGLAGFGLSRRIRHNRSNRRIG